MNSWTLPSCCNFSSTESGDLVAFNGKYFLLGAIRCRFSAAAQSDASHHFRGTISIMSPTHPTRVLQASSRQSEQASSRKLKLSLELNISTCEKEKILEYIHKRAVELFIANDELILSQYRLPASRDRITPALACVLYADDYLTLRYAEKTFAGQSEEDLEKLNEQKAMEKDALLDFYCNLDNTISMSDYSSTHAHKLQRLFQSYREKLGKKLTRARKSLLRSFWQYCLTRDICDGDTNPLEEEPTVSKRSMTAATKADRTDVMSSAVQRNLEEAMSNNPTGEACALALLYSGFSAIDTCRFCWHDIIFDPNRPDFVCVKFIRGDLSGTLHDFTRPIVPASALVLRLRYLALLQTSTSKEVAAMPVASQLKDPSKAISKDYLIQLAKKSLAAAGFLSDNARGQKQLPISAINTSVLQSTYEYNLRHMCGITDDGTFLFLLGHSVSSLVTYAHYTSLTCPEGLERLYTLLKPCAARHKNEVSDIIEPRPIGEALEELVAMPEWSNQRINVGCTITLQPGEEFSLECAHGVTGEINVISLDK